MDRPENAVEQRRIFGPFLKFYEFLIQPREVFVALYQELADYFLILHFLCSPLGSPPTLFFLQRLWRQNLKRAWRNLNLPIIPRSHRFSVGRVKSRLEAAHGDANGFIGKRGKML
jgi:hypothetical protein